MLDQSIDLTKSLSQRFAGFSHPLLLQRMLNRLPMQNIDDNDVQIQPLKSLTSSSAADPTIALLDAWAAALNVLSFYQQRFNQESYLTTANELRSIYELAYAVGYTLEPGIAASTYLAFTVDEDANNTGRAVIPKGIKVLSVPRNDELPQMFETSTDCNATAEWNQLYPAQDSVVQEQIITGATTSVKLIEDYGLEIGAVLIIEGKLANMPVAYALTIQQVESDDDFTFISWQQNWADGAKELSGSGLSLGLNAELTDPKLWLINEQLPLFGYNNSPSEMVYHLLNIAPNLIVQGATKSAAVPGIDLGLKKGDKIILQGKKGEVSVAYYLKLTDVSATEIEWHENWADADADLSGNHMGLDDNERLLEPKFWLLHQRDELLEFNPGINTDPSVWENSRGQLHKGGDLYLSQTVTNVPAGTFVMLKTAEQQKLYRINAVNELSVTDFGISARVSALQLRRLDGAVLSAADYDTHFTVRITTACLTGTALTLATDTLPMDSIIQQHDNAIKLDRRIPHPKVGQWLAIAVLPEVVKETVSLKAIDFDVMQKQVILTLNKVPRNIYQANTLSIKTQNMDKAIAVQLLSIVNDNMTQHQLRFNAAHNPISADTRTLELHGRLQQYSEVFKLSAVEDVGSQTWLSFDQDLQYAYPSAISVIYANIAAATHGETVTEVLGSGDGSKRNQRFTLQKAPLTYLPAATAKGIRAELEIRVNGILWQEADNLHQLALNSRCYVLINNEQGQTDVLFGDGDKGARLPTGQDNIIATYRYGSGLNGVLPADSLTLLQTTPQGVSAVTNPVAATGGGEPETLDQIKQDLPQTVLALGRVVSLRDYESFIQTYVGINKAQAVMLQARQGLIVYVTVISKNAADPLQNGSLLYQSLVEAVKAVSNPGQSFEISECERIGFNIGANLIITQGYSYAQVLQNAKQALQNYFAADKRELGQPVTGTEVIQTLQQVEGITAVDLNELFPTGEQPKLYTLLVAKGARSTAEGNQPAQLLVLNTINLGGM